MFTGNITYILIISFSPCPAGTNSDKPSQWSVRGQVVRVIDLTSLAPQRCWFESRHGLWILLCEGAIQLAYGMLVVLLMWCPLVSEIIHGGASEVFLH